MFNVQSRVIAQATWVDGRLNTVLLAKLQDDNVLERFKADGVPGPLTFVSAEARNRYMFRDMDEQLKDKLQIMPLGMENHEVRRSPPCDASLPFVKGSERAQDRYTRTKFLPRHSEIDWVRS